jgi:parallel beta-helix repeat protein
MQRKIVSIGIALVMLVGVFAVAMLMGGVAEPQKIYVDDDALNDPGPNDPAISDPLEDGSLEHPFDTIQEGVDKSVDGDTVHVFEGTYNEEVEISNSIVLEGENNATTTIQGSGTGSGIYMSGMSGVTIKNLNVNGFPIGIYLFSSSNNTISGNIVSDSSRYGIYLNYHSHGNMISGNTVSTNDLGIRLYSSDKNTISENIVSSNTGGLSLHGSSNDNMIDGNIFSENSDSGMMIPYNCGNNVVRENMVSGSYLGIYLYQPKSSNFISENTFTDNWIGIYLFRSANTTIYGNNVSGNQGALTVISSVYITISWNTISDNYGGLHLDNSNTNQIYHNNFIDNTKHHSSLGLVNTWDDGKGKGNYWSDYEGLDNDGDGVGDTELPHRDVDSYPLMEPWEIDDELIYLIEELIEDIEEMGLEKGTEKKLVAKLENAIKSIEKGKYDDAINHLNSFIKQVESELKKGNLTEEQAASLISEAQAILEHL